MALPVGEISFSQVNVELARPATQELEINDADVRSIAGVGGSGTVISMDDLRGKSARVQISLVISSATLNYDIYTNRGPSYVAGKSDITLTINSGVPVGSSNTGTAAISVPSAFDSDDTVTIVNQGIIYGRGGNGGNSSAGSGGIGGRAIQVQRATTIDNQSTIAAGGGGGGAGPSRFVPRPFKQGGPVTFSGGGGGGGAGVQGGAGGSLNGGTGTSVSGGAGGFVNPQSNPGGSGGGLGASGSNAPFPTGGAGGAAGSYIVGNPFVTFTNTGTRQGSVS
jgi:hypothetical protein